MKNKNWGSKVGPKAKKKSKLHKAAEAVVVAYATGDGWAIGETMQQLKNVLAEEA